MADRYLRATGNWNGAVWAATSSGTAGSAATPTASDRVYIDDNFAVTLTANAVAGRLNHTNGTLSLGSYKLTLEEPDFAGLSSSGNTARTINMDSGTLEIKNTSHIGGSINFSGSNLTFNAGSSHIIIHAEKNEVFIDPVIYTDPILLETGSKTFNDVQILMGIDELETTLGITGSPTFRSLIIQSKNSEAHTVNFDAGAIINTSKFIAIGSSSSNRLRIGQGAGGTTYLSVNNGSSYGQFVSMGISEPGTPSTPPYIGSNSIQDSGMGWLLQDPPKISTLVDPLTTAHGSNANWAFTGTITDVSSGAGGGGYQLAGGATMVSTDTYDLVDNYLIFENFSGTGKFVTWDFEETLEVGQFYRFSVSDTNDYLLEKSADAYNWTTVRSTAISDYLYYKSSRIIFNGATTVGSVNVIPAPAITGKIINISSIMGISKITL